MSFTTIVTKDGERWDQVAFRAYGVGGDMRLIMDANPDVGLWERLPAGIVLTVPVVDGPPVVVDSEKVPPWKR